MDVNAIELKRFIMRLSFDGSAFHGWQKQQNAESVQQRIDDTLSMLCGMPIETLGCGRTDSGVHALDYILHVDLPASIQEDFLVYKLNKILPNTICVHTILPAPLGFHARFDAE